MPSPATNHTQSHRTGALLNLNKSKDDGRLSPLKLQQATVLSTPISDLGPHSSCLHSARRENSIEPGSSAMKRD